MGLHQIVNFCSGPQWIPGVINDIVGPLTYLVMLEDGRVIRRHIDHLLQRENTDTSPPLDDDLVIPNDTDDTSHTPPAASRDTDNSTEC